MSEIKSRGYAHPDALVSTDWVAEHLQDPHVRIVESNEDPLLYPSGHIAGAVEAHITKTSRRTQRTCRRRITRGVAVVVHGLPFIHDNNLLPDRCIVARGSGADRSVEQRTVNRRTGVVGPVEGRARSVTRVPRIPSVDTESVNQLGSGSCSKAKNRKANENK